LLIFLQAHAAYQHTHSFPTRRSSDLHEVINPATEEAVTEITLGSEADVDHAVAAARKAFESFARTSIDERVALIEAILAEYKNRDRKSTRLNSSHVEISYAVFCLKKK